MGNHAHNGTELKGPDRNGIARVIRVASIPIILAWVVLVIVLNALVPQLGSSATSTPSHCHRRTRRHWWR